MINNIILTASVVVGTLLMMVMVTLVYRISNNIDEIKRLIKKEEP